MSVSASTLLDLCALLCDILAIVWLCGVEVNWGGSDKWHSVAFAALAVVLRLAAHTIHPWRSFTSAVRCTNALVCFSQPVGASAQVKPRTGAMRTNCCARDGRGGFDVCDL